MQTVFKILNCLKYKIFLVQKILVLFNLMEKKNFFKKIEILHLSNLTIDYYQ
jgi:hypothetical protein